MKHLISLSAFVRLTRHRSSRILIASAFFAALAPAATVPEAPKNAVATPFNTYASVAFLAPANDGGSPVISYTAIAQPGNITVTGTGSPLIVTGLTNGNKYIFKVYATNSVGSGPLSAASDTVIPVAPSAPYIVFEQSVYIDTLGVAVSLIPTTGGNLTKCSVYPSLPLGMQLNPSTCAITGTPRAITTASDYSVVASNGSSYSIYVLNITIVSPPAGLLARPAASPAATSRNFGIPDDVLKTAGSIRVRVSDARGVVIREQRFEDGEIRSGRISWDGRASSGERAARGLYFLRADVYGGDPGSVVYLSRVLLEGGP